jgi:hypothetical protein
MLPIITIIISIVMVANSHPSWNNGYVRPNPSNDYGQNHPDRKHQQFGYQGFVPIYRFTMIITIYTAILTGAILHLIAIGYTTTIKVGPIRVYNTTDKIRGLLTGEIKSENNGITSMKIMDRPRIKEKAAAGIISNDLTITRAIQKN